MSLDAKNVHANMERRDIMAKDLTTGKPWKVIARFSLPVIGGNLFQLFYTHPMFHHICNFQRKPSYDCVKWSYYTYC